MIINFTIDDFVVVLAVITLASFFVVLARWFYYRRLAVQMKLRALTAETISNHVDGMKAKHEFTKTQKDFLNSMLDLACNRKVVLPFLHALSQAEKRMKQGNTSQPSELFKMLKVKDGSELSADIAFLMFLCILHASTYSFFFGLRFCKRFLAFLEFSPDLQEVKKSHARKAVISRYLNSFPFPNDFFTGTAKHA